MKPLSTIVQAITGCLLIISCNHTPRARTVQVQSSANESVKDYPSHPKTAEELRQELAETEAADPAGMLLISGTMQENKILIQKPDLFHHSKYATDGYMISGIIRNKASIAPFKDAIVRVTFYTETRTELDHKDYPVYKYVLAQQVTPFELKVYPPESTKDFNMEVVSATAIRN
ncbi:hypothetical protein A4D02_15800 [Niastella koreensis]|uniref:Lipoprotein n=2 Tax=Niastella koreensis TaxID=354356 RepID=G8TPJ1_NIAKG|nr:hypothetical protein [Niastella koreensis]AEV97812.1 hypothetical protein Niako_1441 [Niastella koreensis GR20-10]OQP40378.1 hypothetical protein A4D02_15800 [Niastella koreensis]